MWFPAREDECAGPSGYGEQGDGAGNDDGLLSLDRDTERLGINDFFSRRVCHSWRSEQNQSQQDQQDADDFQPQRFCPSHVRMVADAKASRAGER
jgi:hypothetical protein